jgi:hypothetical protein
MQYERSNYPFSGTVLFIGKTAPFSIAHYHLIDSGLDFITRELGFEVDDYFHIVGSGQKTDFKLSDSTQTYHIPISVRTDMVTANILELASKHSVLCSMKLVDDVDSDCLWVDTIANLAYPGSIIITSNMSGVKSYFDTHKPFYYGFVHCSEDQFGRDDQEILKTLNVKSIHSTEIRTMIVQGDISLAKKFLTKDTIDALGL